MNSISNPDFGWVEELKEDFSRSFPGDYQPHTLLQFQQYVEKELQMSSNQNRLSLLFETLLDFYSHFCWKIKFRKPSEDMRKGFIQLLTNLIRVGITIGEQARLKTILTVLTDVDKEDLIFSSLLMVNRLKKKSRVTYGILLRNILCSGPLCPSSPETYLKVVLLLRRLQSLTHEKAKHRASPPPHTIEWLRIHCPKALPKDPKLHTLSSHLLQKKLPSDVLEDLREMLTPSYDENLYPSPLKETQIEVSEPNRDLFSIDSVGLLGSQDQNDPSVEPSVSEKKRKKEAKKTSNSGQENSVLLNRLEESFTKKKSKRISESFDESKSYDERNLLNAFEDHEVSVSFESNAQETKSEKKCRKKKKKSLVVSFQSDNQADENTGINLPEIENECKEPSISFSAKKKRHLLSEDAVISSELSPKTKKKNNDSPLNPKKRKVAKTEESKTPKKVHDQSKDLFHCFEEDSEQVKNIVTGEFSSSEELLNHVENEIPKNHQKRLKSRERTSNSVSEISMLSIQESSEKDLVKNEFSKIANEENVSKTPQKRKRTKSKKSTCKSELNDLFPSAQESKVKETEVNLPKRLKESQKLTSEEIAPTDEKSSEENAPNSPFDVEKVFGTQHKSKQSKFKKSSNSSELKDIVQRVPESLEKSFNEKVFLDNTEDTIDEKVSKPPRKSKQLKSKKSTSKSELNDLVLSAQKSTVKETEVNVPNRLKKSKNLSFEETTDVIAPTDEKSSEENVPNTEVNSPFDVEKIFETQQKSKQSKSMRSSNKSDPKDLVQRVPESLETSFNEKVFLDNSEDTIDEQISKTPQKSKQLKSRKSTSKSQPNNSELCVQESLYEENVVLNSSNNEGKVCKTPEECKLSNSEETSDVVPNSSNDEEKVCKAPEECKMSNSEKITDLVLNSSNDEEKVFKTPEEGKLLNTEKTTDVSTPTKKENLDNFYVNSLIDQVKTPSKQRESKRLKTKKSICISEQKEFVDKELGEKDFPKTEIDERNIIKTPEKGKEMSEKSTVILSLNVEENARNAPINTVNQEGKMSENYTNSKHIETVEHQFASGSQCGDLECNMQISHVSENNEDKNIGISVEFGTSDCKETFNPLQVSKANTYESFVGGENTIGEETHLEKKECTSPSREELTVEKDENITTNQSGTKTSLDLKSVIELPESEVEIKDSTSELNEKSMEMHTEVNTASIGAQFTCPSDQPLSLPETEKLCEDARMWEEDLSEKTVCLGNENQNSMILIQELKEESTSDSLEMACKNECMNSGGNDPQSSIADSNLSLHESTDVKDENLIKQEEKLGFGELRSTVVVDRPAIPLRESKLIRYPLFKKRDYSSDDDSSDQCGELVGFQSNRQPTTVEESCDLKQESEDTPDIELKTDASLTTSMHESGPKNVAVNVQVCVKSQSSDSEMSSREANINDYEEGFEKNTDLEVELAVSKSRNGLLDSKLGEISESESVNSYQSSLESLDLEESDLSENSMANKKAVSSGRLCIDESKLAMYDSLFSDSDQSSSLDIRRKKSGKSIEMKSESSGITTRSKKLSLKKIDVTQESTSTDLGQHSRVSYGGKKKAHADNAWKENKFHSTPKTSKSTEVGKNYDDSIMQSMDHNSQEEQHSSNEMETSLSTNTKSLVKQGVDVKISSGENKAGLSLKEKRCGRKSLSRKSLGVSQITKPCSIVLVDILESEKEFIEENKSIIEPISGTEHLLCDTNEEQVHVPPKKSELNSERRKGKSSLDKKIQWTLSFESDNSSDVVDEKKKMVVAECEISPSRICSKAGSSSDLKTKKNTTASPKNDPSSKELFTASPDREISNSRYNLRRSCKKFPNYNQPSAQKLGRVPEMTFSPLIRKAADYPEFSDVSASEDFPLVLFKEEEKFNDEYRESPSDVTVMLKVEDEEYSNDAEPDSQPIVSKIQVKHSEQMSPKDAGSVESPQEDVSENSEENEPSQPIRVGKRSKKSPKCDQNSDSKFSLPGSVSKKSKSSTKVTSTPKGQKPARGYSLRSRVDLDINLDMLTIGTPRKVESIQKVKKEDKPTDLKETQDADNCNTLRRSRRNLVLPGKLKL